MSWRKRCTHLESSERTRSPPRAAVNGMPLLSGNSPPSERLTGPLLLSLRHASSAASDSGGVSARRTVSPMARGSSLWPSQAASMYPSSGARCPRRSGGGEDQRLRSARRLLRAQAAKDLDEVVRALVARLRLFPEGQG